MYSIKLTKQSLSKFKLMTYLGFIYSLRHARVTATMLVNQIRFQSNAFLLRDHAVKAFDFDQ